MKNDRSAQHAASLARYEAERKEVPDPHRLGELRMLLATLAHPALSAQGRDTTRRRAVFLLDQLPDALKAEFFG